MTNTVWQQRQPMRRYLQEGTPPYSPDDTVEDPEQFQRDIAEADQLSQLNGAVPPPMAATYAPVAPSDVPVPQGMVPDGPSDLAPAPIRDVPGLRTHMPVASPIIAAQPNDPYVNALNRLEALQSQFPVRDKPKWYEKLAAAGLGAAAGYSNAAGRTRNPIDIAKTNEAIMYPGYQDKLAQWQSRVIPAEKIAELEGQKAAAGWKGQQIQSEAQLKQAQVYQAMQHGQYWLSRSEQERNQWKIDPKSGELINTVNGSRVPPAQTEQDRYQIAMAMKATPDEARYYALNKSLSGYGSTLANDAAAKQPTMPSLYLQAAHGDPAKAIQLYEQAQAARRAQKERDPYIDLMKAAQLDKLHNDELDRVANTKITQESRIREQEKNEINQLLNVNRAGSQALVDPSGQLTPEGQKAVEGVRNKYVRPLQNVQNEFASEARRRGVPAEDWDVFINPQTHQIDYRQRPGTPPPPVPPTVPPVRGSQPPGRQAPATPPPSAAPVPHKEGDIRYNADGTKAVQLIGNEWKPIPVPVNR